MAREKTNIKTEKKPGDVLFSKDQITDSKKYEPYRDFLCGNLSGDKRYTLDEVDEFINTTYKEV